MQVLQPRLQHNNSLLQPTILCFGANQSATLQVQPGIIHKTDSCGASFKPTYMQPLWPTHQLATIYGCGEVGGCQGQHLQQ